MTAHATATARFAHKLVAVCLLLAALAASGLAAIGTGSALAQDDATPAAPIAAVSATDAVARLTAADGTIRFEIAEDATRFVWAAAPVDEDGMPAYGTAFITQGYIYPEATLDEGSGVLPDGSPEFPDQVLGQWTCRGWFVGEGMKTQTGPLVITTQLYNFGAAFGDATLSTEGYELVDVGVAIERAITGGTGPFAGAAGDGEQTLLGLNATEGVNLSFALDVEPAQAAARQRPVMDRVSFQD